MKALLSAVVEIDYTPHPKLDSIEKTVPSEMTVRLSEMKGSRHYGCVS
jgi:hypothetical protein